MQSSIGGPLLPYEFWRKLAEIENLVAVKIAPFNRYQTLDVVRAVADSGRAQDVALYTGNDDHILLDLLTEFDFGGQRIRFAGGLLGQWAVWTKTAVCHFERVKRRSSSDLLELLRLAQQLTDANAALFDPAHDFRGCIPGIHELLRRQGLLKGRWCLDSHEDLSPGQLEEIEEDWHVITNNINHHVPIWESIVCRVAMVMPAQSTVLLVLYKHGPGE